MSIYTKRYADGQQRDPKRRKKNRIVHNPRANFHYPRASIKARERSEFKSKAVKAAIARGVVLAVTMDAHGEENEKRG